MLTPQEFVAKWERVTEKESASYVSHFEDVCRLVGHETPSEYDGQGKVFAFQRALKKETGEQGFADVWFEGQFAVEYKGKDGDLEKALNQLKQYAVPLNNPPLLVVCNIDEWEIHTRFNGYPSVAYKFKNSDIPQNIHYLRAMFKNPVELRSRVTREELTKTAASVFQMIAENMRKDALVEKRTADSDRIARFLTKLIFCLFAEDVELLPRDPNSGEGIFTTVVKTNKKNSAAFMQDLAELFQKMDKGGRFWGTQTPRFNGTLFQNVDVEKLLVESIPELERASRLDWSSVEPSIFGTLFERVLDPAKRGQLGAHYTSEKDIKLIVEPVLMQPLIREWERLSHNADEVRTAHDRVSDLAGKQPFKERLLSIRDEMLEKIRSVKVLDPACGSGNFLYVSLQLLMEKERQIINYRAWIDLKPTALPGVHPRQLYGIEIDPIAHALASIVVWIGYIQWGQRNGYGRKYNDYIETGDAVLEMMHDNIRLMDAIMTPEGTEPEWAEVDVIVGNPPFLGGKKMRSELGDYVDTLFKLYEGRVPHEADLVTYWFEKARTQIEKGFTKRAGLLSTNSIRGGANRVVLERIKTSGDLFMAWSDREWILDGAAVRVSMIGFDNGSETVKTLDGSPVSSVNPDLTTSADVTQAKRLKENSDLAFMGVTPAAPFDITGDNARAMVKGPNTTDKSNSDIIRPYYNAMDITGRSRDVWTIDFGTDTTESIASQYEIPFAYLKNIVYPIRAQNNRQAYRDKWWLYAESRPAMRKALKPLLRYLATPMVSKHRIFVWLDPEIVPANLINVIARQDDYFFGVLHSRLHEVWSLRMGTSLEDRPRYTPTTTFETFPFPFVPGKEAVESAAYQAISAAAKQLHEERHAWLNPAGVTGKSLQKYTLTNLYNALQVFRGQAKGKVEAVAGDFAPRLDVLHKALDAAVCAAYGWDVAILSDEEAMLRALLALNHARAGVNGA